MEAYTRVSEPELSFVMPCYNEQDIIGYTIPRFTAAFKNAGIRLELIAVDNGSRDRTGEMFTTASKSTKDMATAS